MKLVFLYKKNMYNKQKLTVAANNCVYFSKVKVLKAQKEELHSALVS